MIKNSKEHLLFTVGLARKAGKTVVGTDAVCDEIRKKKVFLVLYAADVSANTEKRITDCCTYYGIPHHKAPDVDKTALGSAIGKAFSACIGITDQNLSELISRSL
ncbi:MAG: ribosomal L7Ae/L30e/S12e/Gadd45 family protein [Clostridia bacterium]|nr:ribosomal L7Ae/L30e/S12e/Gadd45 family protein [Clostridia bacterium]